MTCLEHVFASAAIGDVVSIIRRDGGVIVDDFADAPTLSRLWNDLGPALGAIELDMDKDFQGARTRRLSGLFGRTLAMETVAMTPVYLQAARALLQKPGYVWFGQERMEFIPSIQISVGQLIEIHPGEKAQELHRDDCSHLRTHPGPSSRLQLMLAMTHFTAENGGTNVIPGSNLWDDERAPLKSEAIPTEMSVGSGLLWLGEVYHGGGENVTATPRAGLTMAYDLGTLRQEENQYLVVSKEMARQYSKEMRGLLGWEICPPFLGWVEMGDPAVVLGDDCALPGVTP